MKMLVTQSCPILCDRMECSHQVPLSMDSPGKNTGVGYHFLLQGICPTQGLNPDLLHYRQTLPTKPPGSAVKSKNWLEN